MNESALPTSPGVHTWVMKDRTGTAREFLIALPESEVQEVHVAFHPFGSTPESVVYGEAAGDYFIKPLDGLVAGASASGIALVAPRAQGRVISGVSLAWQDHLDAAWSCVEVVRQATGTELITTGGLSMGGLEALVFAARHAPAVSSVWAVNPIIDLRQWGRDIAQGLTESNLLEMAAHDLIVEEVGASLDEPTDSYAARTPLSYVEALAGLNVRLVWSPQDTIIPGQDSQHAHLLADQLRALGGTVDEQIVTHVPDVDGLSAGRFAHEACDVWESIGWLNRMRNSGPSA